MEALKGLFYVSPVIGLTAIVFAKGYSFSAAVFALPQVPLTFFIGFLGAMQVTGVWLWFRRLAALYLRFP